jgi:hypothetical protein
MTEVGFDKVVNPAGGTLSQKVDGLSVALGQRRVACLSLASTRERVGGLRSMRLAGAQTFVCVSL